MTLGEKIHTLRKQKGLSQEQLAEKITISRQAVSKWELGESIPDIDNIVQLSKIFDVSTDFLLKTDTAAQLDLEPESLGKSSLLLPNISIDIEEPVLNPLPEVDVQSNDEVKGKRHNIYDEDFDEDDDEDEDETEADNILAVLSSSRWIIATVIYLAMGFIWGNWHIGWIVFLICATFSFRRFNAYAAVYGVATIAFFLLGFIWGLWHPGWMIFLIAVPVGRLANIILSRS